MPELPPTMTTRLFISVVMTCHPDRRARRDVGPASALRRSFVRAPLPHVTVAARGTLSPATCRAVATSTGRVSFRWRAERRRSACSRRCVAGASSCGAFKARRPSRNTSTSDRCSTRPRTC
jgi:hypothetical protein